VYFPSQKLFYFFIPVIVVLGLFVAFRERITAKPDEGGLQIVAQSNEKRAPLEEEDVNKNGIKDWQERLATEKNTDSLEQEHAAQDTNYKGTKNLTETMGKDLFTQYIELKKSDGYSPAGVDNIAYDITNKFSTVDFAKKYTEKNILILNTSDSSTLKTYANALASIRNYYFSLNNTDQFVFTSFESDDFKNKLTRTAELYGGMTKDIAALSVPSGLTPSHVALLNNYADSESGLKQFSLINDDPARAIQGINTYLQLQGQEQIILKNIAEYLRQNGIIFLTNETGSFWNTL